MFLENDSYATKIVIPNSIQLTNNTLSSRFYYYQNLKYLEFPDKILNISSMCDKCYNLVTAIGGDNAQNMYATFNCCSNLTTAICGPDVTDMSYAYNYCRKLTTPVCGNNVINMMGAYSECISLTEAVCGPNVIYLNGAYRYCNNITTAVCGPNVKYMSGSYTSCKNLTTAVCGPNVESLTQAYASCSNLTEAVCGPKVNNMSNAYAYCNKLQTPVCGNNVTNMSSAYEFCNSLTNAICGPNVVNMAYSYRNCKVLETGMVGPKVQQAGWAYANCINLKSVTFETGTNYLNLSGAFQNCYNLTSIVLPPQTNALYGTFYRCWNLSNIELTNTIALPGINNYTFSQIDSNCVLRVPPQLYQQTTTNSTWNSTFKTILPSEGELIVDNSKNSYNLDFNSSAQTFALTGYNLADNFEVLITPTNGGIINITHEVESISDFQDDIHFVLTQLNQIGEEEITITITSNEFVYTKTITISVVEEIPISWSVEAVDGAQYGFELNNNEYYESKNKGIGNSYALCKLNIINPSGLNVYLDCINYGEANYDFGLISKPDTPLSLSSNTDDSSKLLHSFYGKSMSSIQTVDCGAIEGTIYVKYRKDGSGNTGNDSLQFTVRIE